MGIASRLRRAALLALAALAGCSSSLGSGGSPPPSKTYVVLPSGQIVPVSGDRPSPQ